MSAKSWCKANNISYSTYRNWVSSLGKEESLHERTHSEPTEWYKVEVRRPSESCFEAFPYDTDASIKLSYGEWSLELKQGFEPTLLIQIMKAVEAKC
jgi:hypothetical protein